MNGTKQQSPVRCLNLWLGGIGARIANKRTIVGRVALDGKGMRQLRKRNISNSDRLLIVRAITIRPLCVCADACSAQTVLFIKIVCAKRISLATMSTRREQHGTTMNELRMIIQSSELIITKSNRELNEIDTVASAAAANRYNYNLCVCRLAMLCPFTDAKSERKINETCNDLIVVPIAATAQSDGNRSTGNWIANDKTRFRLLRNGKRIGIGRTWWGWYASTQFVGIDENSAYECYTATSVSIKCSRRTKNATRIDCDRCTTATAAAAATKVKRWTDCCQRDKSRCHWQITGVRITVDRSCQAPLCMAHEHQEMRQVNVNPSTALYYAHVTCASSLKMWKFASSARLKSIFHILWRSNWNIAGAASRPIIIFYPISFLHLPSSLSSTFTNPRGNVHAPTHTNTEWLMMLCRINKPPRI